MKQKQRALFIQRLKYVATDFITTSVAFFMFNIARFYILNFEDTPGYDDIWEFLINPKIIIEQVCIPLLMLALYWLSGYYNHPFGKSRLQEFATTLSTATIATAIIFLGLLINDRAPMKSDDYAVIAILFGLFLLIVYAGRFIITSQTIKRMKRNTLQFRTLIIGDSIRGYATRRQLIRHRSTYGYNVIGFIHIPGEPAVSEPSCKIWEMSELDRVCREERIDQIIIAPCNDTEKTVLGLLDKLYHLDIPVKIAPDTLSYITSGIRLNDIMGEPWVDLTAPCLSDAARNIKRTFDVVASLLFLIAFSPLYLAIAIAVKLDSKGPVIYRQERIGLHQKPFNIYKFRSMVTDAEASGPRLSSEHDSRITRVGRILRKYRLDELPQFWNVLIGDMSVVGPRPERQFYIEQITRQAPYYSLVFQIRPGITSWGMVKFGYASNVTQMVHRTRYDLIYLTNMSLLLDLKILIYTIRPLVMGSGM